jgi:uncharacterized membrane protein (DUF373 family)
MNTKPHDKNDVGRTEHFYRRILHALELIIAGLAILVLIAALAMEVYGIFTTEGYFEDLNHFLHNILTIVVGLEFVRMLIDMTPGNTLEVLIMATARHIIMNHDDKWTLLIGIICIAGLFATRRFLIPRGEMTEDLVELE